MIGTEMSMMLKTVNPEAAEAIDNPPPPPDVGTWVVYKGRAGFSRMMRTEFPALVLGEHKDGGLILMVVMEPEDMMMEDRVPFQSHNQEHFCWRYRRASEAEIVTGNDRINALSTRLAALEDYLAGDEELGKDVEKLGERVTVVESVLASDEIEVLERRVKALEADVKAARKAK